MVRARASGCRRAKEIRSHRAGGASTRCSRALRRDRQQAVRCMPFGLCVAIPSSKSGGRDRCGCRGTSPCASGSRAAGRSSSCSRTSTAISGISPTIERTFSGVVIVAGAQLIVIEAVLFVPEAGAAQRVHGIGDRDEMLEEFRGDVFVGRIVAAPVRAPSTAW